MASAPVLVPAQAHFSATAIPYADLVEDTPYACLMIERNIWFHGVYKGDAVHVTDKDKTVLSLKKGVNLLDKPVWRAQMNARVPEYVQPKILFYPITEDVGNIVHTYRNATLRQEWLEHGTGFLRIRRLNHCGETNSFKDVLATELDDP